MAAYVSMLRGINVGGQKQLRMETLRGIYEDLGFTNVRSYVQSGNLVFGSAKAEPQVLVRRIEAAIEAACGYRVPVFIREEQELQHILKQNPYLNGRHEDISKLHVIFLYEAASEEAWSRVLAPTRIQDEFAPRKTEIYLFCPNGYGKTKLSNSFFERKLGVPATTRNWNTVNALYKMVRD